MFSEFPKLFDRNFAIGYLIPSLVLLLGFTGLLSAFQIATLPRFLTSTNPIISSAVIALFGWLVGILFMGANRDIIRILEGYGKLNLLRAFLRREKNKFNKLQERITGLENRDRNEKEEDELNQLFLDAVTNFPDQEKFVLPTPFGNTIRAFEVYPRLMYGVESIVMWSRLLTVVPPEYKSHIDDAKSHMDFWINLGVSSMLLLTSSVVMRFYVNYKNIPVISFWFWLLIGLEVSVVYLCQYRATRSAILWGQTVKSAFDVYLPDLATKIGLKLPETREGRKLMWQNYGIALLYAREDFLPELSKSKDTTEQSAGVGLLAKIIRFLIG